MPEAVLHPAVAATNQRMYVLGGEDAMQNPVRMIQVTQSSSVCRCSFSTIRSFIPLHRDSFSPPQVYHTARNMWSKVESRTVKNVSAPAVILDDRIYIIGGR